MFRASGWGECFHVNNTRTPKQRTSKNAEVVKSPNSGPEPVRAPLVKPEIFSVNRRAPSSLVELGQLCQEEREGAKLGCLFPRRLEAVTAANNVENLKGSKHVLLAILSLQKEEEEEKKKGQHIIMIFQS